MSAPSKNRRPILIDQINFLWYVPTLLAIAAVVYAALNNIVPSWLLLLAMFAAFMWLFSLAFAVYVVAMRWLTKRKESRQ